VKGSQASTQSIVRIMNNAVTYDLAILLASLLVCNTFAVRIVGKLSQEQKSATALAELRPSVV
jgi:hypothetical protein